MMKLFTNALGYLALAMIMTWPMVSALETTTVGYPNVDALDTIMLRGLVPQSLTDSTAAWVYFPSGFPVLSMVPNLVDHLTSWPFISTFPFPVGDNLWWLLVLMANGLVGHRLGRNAGNSEAAGWMGGIMWMLCEPLLREVNLHHGPQALAITAPLYIDALLTYRRNPTVQRGLLAGLWMALAGLTYWYLGLFLAMASIPLLLGVSLRHGWSLLVFPVGLCLPLLAPLIAGWGETPMTNAALKPGPLRVAGDVSALPVNQQFVAQHGNDLLFWWRSTPMDSSNRVGLSLILAALIGSLRWQKGARRALWCVALLGSVFLLGPALRWGPDLWIAYGKPILLPFSWLSNLHPVFERLSWPERWGLLIPLALIPLAAKTRKPLLWAALFAIETTLFSANFPLQTISLEHQRCWAGLKGGEGAVLELPLSRPGVSAPWVGVHQRFHERPTVNPILLPPGVQPPKDWRDWTKHHVVTRGILAIETGRNPPVWTSQDVATFTAEGVGTIALDLTASEVQQNRLLQHLVPLLGTPTDLGCAKVWTLRGRVPEPNTSPKTAQIPTPKLPTLIEPSWSGVQR
jgi:hypothetical protein